MLHLTEMWMSRLLQVVVPKTVRLQ